MNCAVGRYALSTRVARWDNKSSVIATWPPPFSIHLLTTWIMFCRMYLHILCSAISHRLGSRLRSRNDCAVCNSRNDVREFLCFPSSEYISPCEAQWIISKSDAIVHFYTSRQDSACYIFQISLGEFSLLVRWLLHHVTRMHLQSVQDTFPSRRLLGNFSL